MSLLSSRWCNLVLSLVSPSLVSLVSILEERIREATRRGRPLGSDAFVEQVGRMVGRDMRARPPGRPRKETDELTLFTLV